MALAHCIMDTEGYKRTLRMCNINCFSIATIVAGTRLIVTVYVQFLSCYNQAGICSLLGTI